MAVFRDDIILDNIFKEIMSDEEFCKLFPVAIGEYKNIAQGLKSDNKLIVALATALKEIDRTIAKHHGSGNTNNKKDGLDYLNPDEKQTIYRKIAYLITG